MRVAGPDEPQERYRQAPAGCTPVGESRGDEVEERARNDGRSSFPSALDPSVGDGSASAFRKLVEDVGEADELVLLEEPADPQVFGSVGEPCVHRR